MAGFDYSDGLKKLGGTWNEDELNAWLTNPRDVVSGTRMAFPGIKSEKERAAVVAYLRSISPEAPALPKAAPAAEKPAEKPAEPGKP
jgi:cytochrome c